MKVTYNAPATVGRFMQSNAFVRCIVGPVGSGKSSGCLMEVLRRATAQAPGPDKKRRTRFVIIRNTYPELRDTTRKTFEEWIPERLGQWHEQEFMFELKFNDVQSEVLFRALDRPQHIKKLLSLDLTGGYINEMREVPKAVLDLLQTRVGRYPSMAQGGATWFGVWGDTNPWHTGHWGYKLFSQERPDGFELFEQPGGLSPAAENVENLPGGYYPRLCQGKDKEWIEVYVHAKYGSSDRGSIYGTLLDALKLRGGIAPLTVPRDGIHVAFDLGISDSTAMWPWRVGPERARPEDLRLYGQRMPPVLAAQVADVQPGQGVDFLGYHESNGRPLSYFFRVLDAWARPVGTSMVVDEKTGELVAGRGFTYRMFWLPHDARARTLQTGESVLDLFLAECAKKRWGEAGVEIGPELSLEDGISAGRWLLEQDTRFDEQGCAAGLEMLREYRYAWDEKNKVFSKKPLHNFASHGADAFRCAALVAKVVQGLERKPGPPADLPAAVPLSTITMEQAMSWAKADRGRRGGGRI